MQNTTTLLRGDKLPGLTRQAVLRQYTYRLTVENNYPARNPCQARVPAITDAQWLAEHAFYVNRDGRLSRRHKHCMPHYMAD